MEEERGGRPRSFKMDVRSPHAAHLRSSVLSNLAHFLDNYTDDVLAEYIVVLVCNGKNQIQARNDLEAFLGDKTGEFVTWLWHHLSEGSYLADTPSSSLHHKVDGIAKTCHAPEKDNEDGTVKDHQMRGGKTSHVPLINKDSGSGAQVRPSSSNSLSTINAPEDLQRWKPDISAPFLEGNSDEPLQWRSTVPMSSIAPKGNHSEGTKPVFSRIRSSPKLSAGDKQSQVKIHSLKTARSKSVEKRYLSTSPRIISRNLESTTTDQHSLPCNTEETAMKKLPLKGTDPKTYQNTRPRGNVWDRLGKPCEVNNVTKDPNNTCHESGTIRVGGNFHTARAIDEQKKVLNASLGSSIRWGMEDSIGSGSSVKRKRQLELSHGDHSATYSGNKDENTSKKLLRSSSTISNPNPAESLSEFIAVPKPACSSVGVSNVSTPAPSNKKPTSQLKTPLVTSSERNAAIYRLNKSESHNDAADNTMDRPKHSEILDVKSKLRQVEMEMLKLRAKQVEIENVPKTVTTLASGGQSYSEDIKLRTICVTNVHFAATKEALSLHFANCGVIVNVTLLVNSLTGKPKGCAYIVFSNKDSAEKALALNGTSFWSRILKVTKKEDAVGPGEISEHNKPVSSPQRSLLAPSHKASFQRPNSTSQFQWRRSQPTSEEPSTAA